MSVHCIPQFFDSDPIRTDDTLLRHHRILKIAYRNIAFLYESKNQNDKKNQFLIELSGNVKGYGPSVIHWEIIPLLSKRIAISGFSLACEKAGELNNCFSSNPPPTTFSRSFPCGGQIPVLIFMAS